MSVEKMIIQSELECRKTNFRIQSCSIDKIVELSPAEFAEFTPNPLVYHDFIKEFNNEKHALKVNIRSCILVLGKHEQDGILIDPQGYDYAKYSAFIPNARNLVIQEQYSSLNAFSDKMRWLVDKYTQKAVNEQCDCKYFIDLNAIKSQFRNSGFSDELFTGMLSERPEIENAESEDGYCIVTIAKPYLQYEHESLRKLNLEEVSIMCAKHILWLHDAGGEQADFSNCLLKDLNLSRKSLSNALFNNTTLSNVNLKYAELGSAVFNNAKIYNCDMTNVYAEGSNSKNAECIESDFDNGIFVYSNFTDTNFIYCSMNGSDLQNCCLDRTNFGDMYLGLTKTNECCYGEQIWVAEQDGSAITM